ncbi:hypothetical protein ACHAWT_002957 [Skeletonema menzelii]
MAHYKRDQASNRDALFGGASSGGGGKPRPSSTRSAASPTAAASSPASSPTVAAPRPSPRNNTTGIHSTLGSSSNTPTNDPQITPGPSSIFGGKIASRNRLVSILNGQAKIDKMAEAEDYRLKAKQAMTRGIFSKPDPISAANFYKRAADAYKACGENRLERLHRIASGDLQMGQDAYATAAAEYTRAAELAEISEETLARKRQECHKLHSDAATAWTNMGEKGRAAESTVKAAFGLIMGQELTAAIDKKALARIEESIETFVPDPLNRKRNYRRNGISAYDDPNADPNDQLAQRNALELAKQNIVTDAFAHETLFQIGAELIRRRHYESALYALGAGTASLEAEGFATVSLSRAYVSETILTLAMGDTVAALQDFQRVHLQRTSYLSSRECALGEDLIRACDAMDLDALDVARSKTGPHRAALANLEPALRGLVVDIRVSGRAKKEKKNVDVVSKKPAKTAAAVAPAAASPRKSPPTPSKAEKSSEDILKETAASFEEMDDIMNQMGLGDGEEDDDDEIDLT